MRSKRIPAEEQYRLIMECRQSGLTDHQWCVEHDIKLGNFLQLGKKGCVRKVVWICQRQPDAAIVHRKARKLSVTCIFTRLTFIDEQPLNVIPVATERNNLSVAEPMKLSVGSFHLTIPNGTDPQLLAQTLRIVKELEC